MFSSRIILMKIKAIWLSTIIIGIMTACTQANNHGVTTQTTNIEQLNNYDWYLIEATDSHNRPLANFVKDSTLKLQFNNRKLNVSGGCNVIASTYQLDGNTMFVPGIISTLMTCTSKLMAQDEALTKFMNQQKLNIALIKSEDDQLKLRIENKNGSHLLWRGVQTTTSQYGQPTVAFWEISNKTRTCKTSQGKRECLQVRDVVYNDQGIKVQTGMWRNFAGEIEGWQFNAKEKQIVRLNVYQIKSTDATKGDFIYKLDQIIERTVTKY